MGSERLVVSFCIPVYNNAEAAEKIAEGLFVSDDARFEVIMCDDNSSDDTQERLRKIHDGRFRYVRNEKNLGTHRNWLKSLELGRSEWLYLAMGRDGLKGENIGRLIELLDYAGENNITCLEDGYSRKQGMKIYDGINAMIHFISAGHPTGSVFRRSIFDAITDREYYFTHSDMYPENYIRNEMLLKGRGASVMSGVYTAPNPIVNKLKIKSTVENGRNIYDMFFAPKRRIKQYLEMTDIIDGDTSGRFTGRERTKFFRKKFGDMLLSVSKGWKGACANKRWMAHYGHEVRAVTRREQYGNIIQAFRETAGHLKAEGRYSFWRRVSMLYLSAKRFRRVFFGS